MLPDLDHPQSIIARALGPASQLLAVATATVASGHRHATPSLAFAALAGLAVVAGQATPAGPLVGSVVVALVRRPRRPRSGPAVRTAGDDGA